MRVVVLHESPDADPAAAEFRQAAETFNRGLDIRLRFLDVGFELRAFAVREDDEDLPVRLERALDAFRPGVVLVLGRGPRLLECAAVAAKGRFDLAYAREPEPDRTATAIDRLASIVLAPGPEVDPDPRVVRLDPEAPAGRAVVDTLVRSVRVGRNP